MNVDQLHNLVCQLILDATVIENPILSELGKQEVSSKFKLFEVKLKQLIEVNDEPAQLAYLTERAAEIGMVEVAKIAFKKFMDFHSHLIESNQEVVEYIKKYAPVLS
ncbi:MAG: hypothetical protein V3575_04580 [Candidatus Absconditabacteria bacterium]